MSFFCSLYCSKLYGDQARFFEMETNPRIKHKKLGAVAMVNNGDNMHGSQVCLNIGTQIDCCIALFQVSHLTLLLCSI